MTIVVSRPSSRVIPEHLLAVQHQGHLDRMCRLWLDIRAEGLLPYVAVAQICELLASSQRLHDVYVRRKAGLSLTVEVGSLCEEAASAFTAGWADFLRARDAERGLATEDGIHAFGSWVQVARHRIDAAFSLIVTEP